MLVVWEIGCLVVWSFGCLVVWELVVWSFSRLVVWGLVVWLFGGLVVWGLGDWSFGYMPSWPATSYTSYSSNSLCFVEIALLELSNCKINRILTSFTPIFFLFLQ